MTEYLKRLRARMSSMSDAELLRVVNVEYRDYRPEALEYARAELDSRGLAYSCPKHGASSRVEEFQDEPDSYGNLEVDDDTAEPDQDDLPELRPSFCIVCGAETRCGYLFGGGGEMTVVFLDNNEERFVQLDACPKCGHVRLIVDFETEVES